MRKMIVAIDFDGCITNGEYGTKLELQKGAKESIIQMYNLGIDLILWTCRGETNGSLYEAKEFLHKQGLFTLFSKFNDGSDFTSWGNNRKVLADVYIDDKMVGGWCGWDLALKWVKQEFKKITQLPTITRRI